MVPGAKHQPADCGENKVVELRVHLDRQHGTKSVLKSDF